MNMSFRSRMSTLHTWTGLLLGWVLYFMFVTGTLGYLDTEIDRWMKPELPKSQLVSTPDKALQTAFDYLNTVAPNASNWLIQLPKNRNQPYLQVHWKIPGEGARQSELLDMHTGQPFVTRETKGGQLLYQMHWKLHYLPRTASDWIITLATLFMLVAIVSGVIVHKKIFTEFFTFRAKKGARSWLDMHNLMSVTTLPFQIMITYSGLVFMMFVCFPWIISTFYGPGEENKQQFFHEVFVSLPDIEPTGLPANMHTVAELLEKVSPLLPANRISLVEVEAPNDEAARIAFNSGVAESLLRSAEIVTLNANTGDLVLHRSQTDTAARGFRDVMLGLHEGLYAGPLLRLLYVVSGLMGCAMVATGLFYWVKSRKKKEKKHAPRKDLRWVQAMNVGVVMGFPVALPVYFLANRLLPVIQANRSETEVALLFAAWLVTLLIAMAMRTRKAIICLGVLGGLLYTLVPFVSATTAPRHLFNVQLHQDWVLAGFDATAFLSALMLAGVVWYATRHKEH